MNSMDEDRIVVLGAGGDALVVAEAIRQAAEAGQPVVLAGFLDDAMAGQTVLGKPRTGYSARDGSSNIQDTKNGDHGDIEELARPHEIRFQARS